MITYTPLWFGEEKSSQAQRLRLIRAKLKTQKIMGRSSSSAPVAPVTTTDNASLIRPGMDVSNFPAMALSTPLIGVDMPKSEITLLLGQDYESINDKGQIVPKFTNPTPEKLALGKVPFPFISFSNEDGKKFRAYGSLALAIGECAFVKGTEPGELISVIDVTSDVVTCHESEL
jgi:hypothetical protein